MEFPFEVWRLILNHFDAESLRKCLLWSDDYRDLIIKTPQLMKKLPVVLHGENWRQKLQFLELYGDYVRSVTFDRCSLSGSREVEKVLRLVPHAEEIKFQHANYEEGNETNEASSDDIEMNKLTSFVIETYSIPSVKLLRIFRNCRTLKSFTLSALGEDAVTFIGDLLSQQNQLETLDIAGHSDTITTFDSVLTPKFMQNSKFKLKKLGLRCLLGYNQNLSQFLRQQSGSLEELVMENHMMDFHYYRLIFNNFFGLNKLSICIGSIMTNARAEEIKSLRLPNVTDLEFLEYCEDVEVFKTVLQIFPNVEMLTADFGFFSLSGILENLPRLEKIVSRLSRIEMFLFAKSLSLREIEFRNMYPIMVDFYWEQLSVNCPSIEKIFIQDLNGRRLVAAVKNDLTIILRGLTRFQNLKHFELINNFIEYTHVNGDADWIGPEPEAMVSTPAFHFLLEVKAQKLSMSSYFRTDHAENIKNLVAQFNITSIVDL